MRYKLKTTALYNYLCFEIVLLFNSLPIKKFHCITGMAGIDFVSIIDETLNKRSLKNIQTAIQLVKLRSKTYYEMDFMDKTRICRNMKNHDCGIWLIPCI